MIAERDTMKRVADALFSLHIAELSVIPYPIQISRNIFLTLLYVYL